MKTIFTKCMFCLSIACHQTIQSDERFEGMNEFDSVTTPLIIQKGKESVVIGIKKINIEGYPKAFNPSLIRTGDGILLIFRNNPDLNNRPYISDTGAVWLNNDLEPISKAELLITRGENDITPQQSEDARVFIVDKQLYIIYNDNIDDVNPSEWHRRDMFIAKIDYINDHFTVSKPIKVIHRQKYEDVRWQKNWMPFDWHGNLLVAYSINPHEIMLPDLETGICDPIYKTQGDINWHWGKLRGGTPAQLVDGRYLAFFHSPLPFISETTQGRFLMHYFMGAYTYNSEPPFNLLSISPFPIVYDNFYTESALGIRCIYPGGFIDAGDKLYIAYGKDDHEVWIATINKNKLYQSMVPINTMESY